MDYYHGGAPRLKMILPPNKTGASTCASYGADKVCDRNKVYLGNSVEHAMIFAAMYPHGIGHVYKVEPIGDIEKDPDWYGEDGACVQCDAAKVIKRIKLPNKVLIMLRKEILKEHRHEKS